MGLKTTNYKVKDMEVVLPEAYAIIRETVTNGNKGYAKIAVHTSRELAENKFVKPYEEIRVDFDVDRNENDRITAYKVAKSIVTKKKHNLKTGSIEEIEEPMPFYGWEDDIVTSL